MSAPNLSFACGTDVENREVSHLQLWQDVVCSRPTAIALISRHQQPSDFRWVGSQPTDHPYIQWTYADLDRGARRLATALNRFTHVERKPIAALVNNQAEWALLYWAAAYLHSSFVPINPKVAARRPEINHMVQVISPVVLITTDMKIANQLEQNLSDGIINSIPAKLILSVSDPESHRLCPLRWTLFSDLMSGDQTPPDTPDTMAGCDEALILFTSGTTSLPKPCSLTSFQCLNAALGYMDAQGINSSHRFVQHLPGFHSYGIGWSLGLWLRGGMIIYPSECFEPQSSLDCFQQFKATHMSLVPTTAQALLAHPAFPKTDLSSLVSIDVSGAGVLPSLIDTCTAALRVPATASYGMTESPGTLVWPVDEGPVVRNGEVLSGRPARACMVKICNPGTRNIVPRGEVGELHNGGAQVILHYMDPTISSENFYWDENGVRWIVTGDQAIMEEDGAVRISGRYKDMIIRGGENISPASIEQYLSNKNGISCVYVVGIPDEIAGEVPVAVIMTAQDCKADKIELKLEASRDLQPAFAPKMILHLKDDLGLNAFPTTASGKIRKVDLANTVRHFLKDHECVSIDETDSTLDAVIGIWRSISGSDSLRPSTLLDSFADSLMMMQLSGLVKRQLSRDITVEDFKLCRTIQDHADLIEARPRKSSLVAHTYLTRASPPQVDEVPHIRGNIAVYRCIQSAVSDMLAPIGLMWDDVEDVIPLPDWDSIFCHRSRPNSWNVRFCYHAPASVEALEAAVRASLAYHPTMRAFALPDDDGRMLMISVRSSTKFQESAITTGWEIKQKENLGTLLLDHPVHDCATIPGPLVRFHIAKILNDGTSGLIMVSSHAACDMSMTKLWLDDVLALLTGSGVPAPHAAFKDYATAFFDHRDGLEADDGIHYWVRKHQGISLLPETTFWPPQRTAEWFKGNDVGWSRWDGTRARPSDRPTSLAVKLRAQRGLRRLVKVQDIVRLKAEHGVPVFMLVKAAIALLNITRTAGTEAVFGTINAARTWPFASDYSALEREAYAGNPLDISGCTTEYVLDRIPVPRDKTQLAFMQQVTRDEEANSGFAHTPFARIVDRLRDPIGDDDARTFAQRERDAAALLPLIRRQSFNWLPTAPHAQNSKGLTFVETLSRMDNGLTIGGFLADDKRSVSLGFTWDAEHLGFREAERALEDLVWLVDCLGREENWGRTVEDALRMEEI